MKRFVALTFIMLMSLVLCSCSDMANLSISPEQQTIIETGPSVTNDQTDPVIEYTDDANDYLYSPEEDADELTDEQVVAPDEPAGDPTDELINEPADEPAGDEEPSDEQTSDEATEDLDEPGDEPADESTETTPQNPSQAPQKNADQQSDQDEIQRIVSRWNQLKPATASPKAISDHTTAAYSIKSPYAAGALSNGFVQDGLNMVNFVRFLSGMPDDITVNSDYSNLCQHGAVLLAGVNYLSHTPGKPANMDQAFYDTGYKGTSQSNIAQGAESLADSVMTLYMQDNIGEKNLSVVGHRRWILNPAMQRTGFGFVLTGERYYRSYSSLYSFDTSRTEKVEYDWIGWPGKSGSSYFPNQFMTKKDPWSVTVNPEKYQTPNLQDVQVTLTQTATQKTWSFSAQDQGNYDGKYLNVDTQYIAIPNCIIFRPDGVDVYDGDYQVRITGIKDKSGQAASIEYTVTFFDLDDY